MFGRTGGGALPMATRLSRVIANSVPFPASRKWDAAFWQDIAQMYSQRALGRQKGVSQARYSRDVFPGIIFHRFSRLKTYIRRLSCQKQAIRACISAISCHEEAFLASERPSRMPDSHSLPPDSHSLPPLDAQPPLHTEHLAALSWQQLSPTPPSLSSHGALSPLIMAAFLLRSPFR